MQRSWLRPYFRLTGVLAASAALAACGTDPNGPTSSGPGNTGTNTNTTGNIHCANPASDGKIDCKAVIAMKDAEEGPITNGKTVKVPVGGLKTGETKEFLFKIQNAVPALSAAELVLQDVKFEYNIASPDEDPDSGAVAFQCFAGAEGDTPCSAGQWHKVVPDGVSLSGSRAVEESFRIRFQRFDNKDRVAKLTLHTANQLGKNEFVVNFQTLQGKPKASIAPETVKWGFVAAGQTKCEKVTVTNVGDDVLELSSINVVGDAFVMKYDGQEYKSGKPYQPDPKLALDPGAQAEVEVCFTAKDDKPKQGELKIKTNDAAQPDENGFPVQLVANSEVPCILLQPSPLINFAGVLVGSSDPRDLTIKNCGVAELDVYHVEFPGTGGGEFSLDFAKAVDEGSKFGDQTAVACNLKVDPKKGPTDTTPLCIPKGGELHVTVKYSPADKTDPPTKPDTNTVTAKSNAFQPKSVQVQGIGVDQLCPVAKVEVKEGEQVVPQTLLHLKGDGSSAPGGPIKKYKWSVKQPPGSNQPLQPNAAFPNPTLLANAAGNYEFCLEVEDGAGNKSCAASCATVLVVPNNAIHVELLWDTPNDPDQTDTGPMAGADMDLHFASQLANGPDLDCDGTGDPWFSNPFDCFWFTPSPNWGSTNPAKDDDPHLDLDDTDGAGPENLNLAEPEGDVNNPVYYSVGVHYWNDHGFGASFATVTLFMQSVQVLKIDKVKMDPLDMWYVGKINWPNKLTGAPLEPVTMCYQTGDACAGTGKMWKPQTAQNADWCITKCYVNPAFMAAAGGAASATSCKKGKN